MERPATGPDAPVRSPRGRRRDALLLATGCLLLGLAWWMSRAEQGLDQGVQAPQAVIPLIVNGSGNITLGPAADGRVTVIEFFAEWCGVCEDNLPQLERCPEAKDVRWISVGVGKSRATTAAAAARWSLIRSVGFDSDGSAARLYGVSAVPTVVVVRPDGLVGASLVGPVSVAQLDRAIRAASVVVTAER